tara:strand:- start:49 stop:321 length:273 start_codon:yes stop_codon:yes gene_type:complete
MSVELSKQTIAIHEPNMSFSEHPDQFISEGDNTAAYDNMTTKARRAGMLHDVYTSYRYFVSSGRSSELAAYLALTEWDLAIVPNLNEGSI